MLALFSLVQQLRLLVAHVRAHIRVSRAPLWKNLTDGKNLTPTLEIFLFFSPS